MRIAVINEYNRCGGAEVIKEKQVELLRGSGNEVVKLCFYEQPGQSGVNDAETTFISIAKIKRIIFSFSTYYKLRRFYKDNKIEFIIANNIFSSPITVFSSFRSIPTIYVTHDSYLLCPTSDGVWCDGTYTICDGFRCENCLKHCGKNNKLLALKVLMHRFIEPIIKRNVDLLVPPSEHLTNSLRKYGYNAECINNPIDIPLKRLTTKNGGLSFAFFGGLSYRKGTHILLDAIRKGRIEYQIDIYGGEDRNIDRDQILSSISSLDNVCYHGKVEHEDVITIIKESRYVVVPSEWVENYPTICLEAMANGTVVIGSKIGGIKELLMDGRGILFEHNNVEDLISAITYASRMPQDKYDKIRQNAFDYVKEHNSYDTYRDSFMKTLKKIKSTKYSTERHQDG